MTTSTILMTGADLAARPHALASNFSKGAGLDVFCSEPHTDARFAALDNVVSHPRHGNGTADTRKVMGKLVRDNLAAHFAGLRS